MTAEMSRVYLTRHGRTTLNAEGRLRGLSDPPLDEVGLAEVARLAKVLATKGVTMVVSSPLQRAVSTAEAIANAAGVPMSIDMRLNDRDYGPMTGRPRAEVEKQYGSVDAAPGVEPRSAIAERAKRAFFELVAELAPGPIVMVSHDAFNQTLLEQLDPSLVRVRQRTACWNQLSLVDGRWRVDAYDQIAE
jgi:broad specificity phosphatase PhoE